MQSRTADGKHTARFIILRKLPGDTVFTRSLSLPGFYATRGEAMLAIDKNQVFFPDVKFKVRQK